MSLEIINGQPVLSVVLAVLAAVCVLYFVRNSAHQLLAAFSEMLYSGFRYMGRAFQKSANKAAERNREVLFEQGREQAERQMDRDLVRMGALVEKEVSKFPSLQLSMSKNISQMEDKYIDAGDVPPPTPEWTEAVELIVGLQEKAQTQPMVGKLLETIHGTITEQQAEITAEYRQDIGRRHEILKSMVNHWRALKESVETVGKVFTRFIEHARNLDQQMSRYHEMINETPKAERLLKRSSSTQFLISLIAVAIAAGIGFVNFNIIALPMSEMVASSSLVAGMDIAQISAMVIILTEVIIGMFLMEALGLTKMFPIISHMDDSKRKFFAWAALILMLGLCCVEAGLAYMREELIEDKQMLTSFLVGGEAAAQSAVEGSGPKNSIALIGQMTLGFILPLVLMLVAIPLESLIHTGRTTLVDGLVMVLKSMAVVCRVIAISFKRFGQVLVQSYDMIVFAPLWIEGQVNHFKSRSAANDENSQLRLKANS